MRTSRIFAALIVFCLPLFTFSVAAELLTDIATVAIAEPAAVSLFGIEFGGVVGSIVISVLSIIGLASGVVKALKPLAAYTETKADDNILATVSRWLSFVTNFTDKYLALNPNKTDARND